MKNIILLHGALFSSHQMEKLKNEIFVANPENKVYSFDFQGHGNNSEIDLFTEEGLCKQVMDFIKVNKIDNPILIGNSMGGYISLLLGLKYPEIIYKIICYNTKLDWNDEFTTSEINKLNPEKIKEKIPHFFEQLNKIHQNGLLNELFVKTQLFLSDLNKGNYLSLGNKINLPVIYIQSNEDTMLKEEDLNLIQKITNNLEIHHFEGKHPIETANLRAFVRLI